MKTLLSTVTAFTLSAGLCIGAQASQPVSDTDVSQKLDQLNATAQVIDGRLQQLFTALNQSAQSGTCWLDGKAYSQGAEATTAGHAVTCGVQAKTGWPQWSKSGVNVN
ncbi:hypothetical protein [Type-D symbiont of Plautia stali]|uniref:hypothetical protein n=1 Tax=Type-D symbiont of Plautia stali TaxID=1560356 RepID=UPI00073E2A88|nr:hypothetical protein [Type-D symbiont of Plautia stali]